MAKKTNAAGAAFPFADADFSKFWGEMKVPAVDVDAFVAYQRKNFEAVAAANQLVAEGLQTVAKRQAELLQETFAEMQKAGQEIIAADTPQARVVKQAEVFKAGFEKSLANAQEIGTLFSQSANEPFAIVQKRVAESFDEVKSAVEKFAA